MAHKLPYRMQSDCIRSEPYVNQGEINGKQITWNPDDNRFYVMVGQDVVATFAGNKKGWSNMVQWARTH